MWSGSISFGLVNIPVKLYAAVSRKSVRFNQIDKNTGARIRYKKVSADSGDEVGNDDIIKGYELPSGDYVTISDDELAQRPGLDQVVELKGEDAAPLAALIFKTATEPHVGELSFFRVFSGSVANGEEVVLQRSVGTAGAGL